MSGEGDAGKQTDAEITDETLFRHTESSYLGDCPICFLPHSLDEAKSVLMTCCFKQLCLGCTHANLNRLAKANIPDQCPFCRQAAETSMAQGDKKMKEKALKMKDPNGIYELGKQQYHSGNYKAAITYFCDAAKLNNAGAHYFMGLYYEMGNGVEKDLKKAIHHWNLAAIGGHSIARYNVGCFEYACSQYERAVKHWMISAKLGHDKSLDKLKDFYREGHVRKDDFAAALRGHQAAVIATKSPQREEAAKFWDQYQWLM